MDLAVRQMKIVGLQVASPSVNTSSGTQFSH